MNPGLVYLLLSMVSSTILILIFKSFPRFKVDTFQAIVVNYFVCTLTGVVFLGHLPVQWGFWQQPWFPFALMLGVLFIVGFNIVARTIQVFGVTVGSVSQKMSLIMSVTFSILYYGDSANWIKILGVLLALVAVVLTNLPAQSHEQQSASASPWKGNILLVVFTFLISGTIEIGLQYVELSVASIGDDPSFLLFLFFTAGILGLGYWLSQMATGKMRPNRRNLLAGLILGVPNYFSMHFLLLTLGQPGWEGSVVYPITNVGIIGLSSLLAFIIFKERLSRINIIGVFAAIIAILMIGFSSMMAGWF